MILIDAIYINRSGSKLLLDYLVESIEEKNLNAYYLFDKRIEGCYSQIPDHRKQYFEAGVFNRTYYYLLNSRKFSFIFCFSGVPPVINNSKTLWCYFHNAGLLISENLNFANRTFRFLKGTFIRIFSFKIDKWLVQSESVKADIHRLWKIPKQKISVAPFFREYSLLSKKTSFSRSLIYVSDAYPHKNHERLFEGFKMASKLYENITLYVTIAENNTDFISLMRSYQQQGLNIINLGFVSNVNIIELYNEADGIIFPSLNETLGLGLIEAAQFGIPIIASDLDYVHAIIKPSYTFDPYSVDSIFQAISKFILGEINQLPRLIISSHLERIIESMERMDTNSK